MDVRDLTALELGKKRQGGEVTAREDAEMQAAIEAAQDMKHDTRLSPEYKEWVRQKAFSP